MLSLTDYFNDPSVIALVTDRSMDFALNGRKFFLTAQQKEVLYKTGGIDIDKIACCKQVHGAQVISVDKIFLESNSLLEADGLMTADTRLPIAVRTADCLPIFIFDPDNKVISVVHAGWRGSHRRILCRAIEQMKKSRGTSPENLKVVFGPSIRTCCYEVGQEFQEYFPREMSRRDNKLYLDLAAVNLHQALQCGVHKENIFDCGACTYCDERFFSYRREGEKAGRMMSLMMLV